MFFNLELAKEFDYRAKQGGQLCSKMRFIAAPWIGMLSDGAWLRHAEHANKMAALLHKLITEIPEAKILFPQRVNSVFVELPSSTIKALHERGWHFYTFIGEGGCRFMCSWDTTEEDVKLLAEEIKQLV